MHFSCNRQQHIVDNWNRILCNFLWLIKRKKWAWSITIILLLIGIAIQIISTTTGSMFNASISDNNSTTANSVISGMAGGIIGYSH
ncbi:MAG: hypothetical protein ACJ71O_10125 [Nitrososphaeraceae archaeon]